MSLEKLVLGFILVFMYVVVAWKRNIFGEVRKVRGEKVLVESRIIFYFFYIIFYGEIYSIES